MEQQQLELIMSRRHPALSRKDAIWQLIADSYAGGEQFTSRGNYLFQYPREGTKEYRYRKARTSYFNYVQPVADILVGLLYTEPVQRNAPERLSYLVESAAPGKNLEAFMQRVAIQSLIHTCGVLVDSPKFDPAEVATMADRIERNLNPYCCLYAPQAIRDYSCGEDGKLEWLLLDNSRDESNDPFAPRKRVTSIRLWTRTTYQDFERTGSGHISMNDPVEHSLGEIPFIFCNWKDVDFETKVGETPFEDIALNSRTIYNLNSLLDEMLYAGTFKVLFYPTTGGNKLPDGLKSGGISNLTVLPFDGSLSKQPYFEGQELGDITPFLSVIDRFEKAILAKVGLDKDAEKTFAQSGVAKSLEYRKAHALLTLGAESLEKIEMEIFRLAALWEGDDKSADITYPRKFDPNETERRVTELYALFNSLPYKTVKQHAAKEILKIAFPDLATADLKKLLEAVDSEQPDDAARLVEEVVSAAGRTTPRGETTANAENGEHE